MRSSPISTASADYAHAGAFTLAAALGYVARARQPRRTQPIAFPPGASRITPLRSPMPDGLILDAELVCLDAAGRPDFARLRRRLIARTRAAVEHAVAAAPATLMIFDLLWHHGEDVSRRTYDDRRALLDALALDGPSWQTPRRFCAARDDLAAATREHQLEGVVAKRRDAPYAAGRRSGAWIKFKHRHRERLHAIAWLPARGSSGREGSSSPASTSTASSPRPAWWSSTSAANAGSR